MNEGDDIHFRAFYVNEEYGYGFEVINTQDNEILKRQVGFKTPQESRQTGFKTVKKIRHGLQGEKK